MRRADACFLALSAFLMTGLTGVMGTSCSLFVDTDGLSGGVDAPDGSIDATSDAGSDAIAAPDGSKPTDAGVDSSFTGDAGSWAFVSSDPKTESGSSLPPLTVKSVAVLQAGDLVVIGCDSGINAGLITFSGFDPNALTLNIAGPHSDGEAYQAEIGWGVARAPIDDFQITSTVASPTQAGFMDCTVNTYRGGGPNVVLLGDQKTTGIDGSGNAMCGPLQTARGGLAYYIAARTSCIGTPMDPAFTQRTGINGNPNGDVVPSDGGIVQSEMNPCNSSTSSWICYMIALTP